MKTIYVDVNGNMMQMESEDREIVLPVLCKQYTGYQTSLVITIAPTIHDHKQINKAIRKRNEKIKFTHMRLKLNDDPSNMFNWEIDGVEQLEPQFAEIFGGSWLNRLDSWHKQYCTVAGLMSSNMFSNLGDTYYLTNTLIGNVKNCTVHLFGDENTILPETLSNVLVHIHGDCNGV